MNLENIILSQTGQAQKGVDILGFAFFHMTGAKHLTRTKIRVREVISYNMMRRHGNSIKSLGLALVFE